MKLLNGAEVTYDWGAISQKEWRALLNKATDEETNDTIVGKLVGMTVEELEGLNPVDYRRVAVGIFESFREAVDTGNSKNSQGASTEE